jgi:hypothetical protein
MNMLANLPAREGQVIGISRQKMGILAHGERKGICWLKREEARLPPPDYYMRKILKPLLLRKLKSPTQYRPEIIELAHL